MPRILCPRSVSRSLKNKLNTLLIFCLTYREEKTITRHAQQETRLIPSSRKVVMLKDIFHRETSQAALLALYGQLKGLSFHHAPVYYYYSCILRYWRDGKCRINTENSKLWKWDCWYVNTIRYVHQLLHHFIW